MKLLIFRNLYLANRGLLQAVEALAELANEPGFSRRRLGQTQERIEELRAWMNTALGEAIDHLETQRGNALEGQRARREERAVRALQAQTKKAASPSSARPRRKRG
jgi:hypothetical protein